MGKEPRPEEDNFSGDQGEDQEDITINSKSVSDTGIQQDEMSFYLSKMYVLIDAVLIVVVSVKALIFGAGWWTSGRDAIQGAAIYPSGLYYQRLRWQLTR